MSVFIVKEADKVRLLEEMGLPAGQVRAATIDFPRPGCSDVLTITVELMVPAAVAKRIFARPDDPDQTAVIAKTVERPVTVDGTMHAPQSWREGLGYGECVACNEVWPCVTAREVWAA